ncbi:MAG: GAF domain-containing protein [Bradyrhizobium sp.]
MAADLGQENARLQAELRAMQDRQAAGAEILRTIASVSGDAARSLQQIAETSARLFGAPSVSLQLVENGEWGQAFRFGNSAVQVRSAVPLATIRIGGPNLPGTVVAENRQIHIPDLDNIHPSMADWPGPPHARAAGTRTMCGTPLRRDGKAIGVLIVYRDRLLPFTEEELALLQSFADQAVIAIENARLFNETRDALARQTATADILRVIASSPSDVQPVFDVIVERAVRLCGARMGRVYRYDDGIIHMVAGHGLSEPGLNKVHQVFPRPAADDTTAGRAIQSRRPNFVADIASDQSVPPLSRQMIEALGTRSQVTVPMLRSGEPIGAITVGWGNPRAYSDQQVRLLQTFADQAVIAIENVRLFNETKEALERQTATADILKVIASSPSDVQPVFEAIVTSAKRLLGSFSSTVFRVIDGTAHLKAFTPTAPEADEILKSTFPRPVADFGPFRMTQAGQAMQIPDTNAESIEIRDIARARGYRSMLFVPLMDKGESIGQISVTRVQPGRFADHDVQLLQTFADQAVIAIENARLFNETKEALERQTATADILKVIASSPSDVQPVFEAIAASANRLIGGFSSTVFRLIDGNAYLKAFTPTTPAADEILKATFPRPAADFPPFQLAQAGEVTQIPDTEALSDEILGISRARGFRSMLFAPLMSDGVSIGFIVVTRVQPGIFADHHVQLLRTFADQAVIAIENARLFEQVQAKTRDLTESLQQQTATADVLKVISRSAFDLQTVLDTLVESAARLCEADMAAITRKKGDDYFRAGSYGFTSEFMDYVKDIPVRPERATITGRTLLEGKVIHVPDVHADPDYTFTEAQRLSGDPRTFLGVPLLREGNPVGALVLLRKAMQPFTNNQVELVTTFADQAVIAIENVRLFDEVQQRTRELAASLDELRTAQDRLVQTEKLASLGQLTAGIAHEIKNPLNFINNFAALSAELTDELNDLLASAALTDKVRQEVDELTRTLKDNLERVVQHGKRADSIVKNMLLHSREGSGEHRPADINALLDESLNLAYHGARAEKPQFNVTLQRDFDAMAGMIELFPQEITRVFLNLISNGFYAVTKRKTENSGSGFEPVLSAATRNLGDTVEIRIRDNGTGIPAEVREKMFNPFFTTKPAGEGTGLGLSMSHDIIVKQHGGRIEVETEPGEFTEFRIVLPRTSITSDKNRGQT